MTAYLHYCLSADLEKLRTLTGKPEALLRPTHTAWMELAGLLCAVATEELPPQIGICEAKRLLPDETQTMTKNSISRNGRGRGTM